LGFGDFVIYNKSAILNLKISKSQNPEIYNLMSLILSIDTATETAGIALGEEERVIDVVMNENQKDHAAWVHEAIQQLLKKHDRTLQQLSAVAVTAGPGSYTGLRVGMATAKGLCYVLSIPLITESTLKVIALAGTRQLETTVDYDGLFCPMIDARRMEVFTAVYDKDLNEVMNPQPMVLSQESFSHLLKERRIVFFGSGSNKFRDLVNNVNASFMNVKHSAADLALLAHKKFAAGDFTELAYAEPVYLKEFHTHTKK
jgi:tRNA threonylcarbamoyladenosine biosynthesis protein TsaB